MLLKLKSGNYVDTATGAVFSVQQSEKLGWQVNFKHPKTPVIHAVENGFESKEDAQAALDEFATEQDAGMVQPPSTEEESEDK